jgi:hypothetical protein
MNSVVLQAEKPKMSSKKKKRLEKYIVSFPSVKCAKNEEHFPSHQHHGS